MHLDEERAEERGSKRAREDPLDSLASHRRAVAATGSGTVVSSTRPKQLISRTSLAAATWTIVEGADARYRSLTLATMVRDAIRKRLAGPQGDLIGMHRNATRQEPDRAPVSAKTRMIASEQATHDPQPSGYVTARGPVPI